MPHDTKQRQRSSAEASHSDESLLRIAEAIADGSPVDWEQELQETPLAEGPWNELRTIESIAAFHAPQGRTGSSTAVFMSDEGEIEHLPGSWDGLIVRERLGKGACASVFRAYDPNLDREVALKLPHRTDPGFSQAFLREARRLARIHHDGVVQVHGADEANGRVGMWMDLVGGLTLEEYLDVHGPLSANEATLVGIDLCRALAAVHGAGLVHRDLKAANVMREKGGRLVLMDFSSVVEAETRITRNNDSSTQGTPYYMAPELLDGGKATKASDIYALGVLLYRLVTGRYPVEADSLAELHEKLDQGGATLLLDARPDLPVGFVEVIDQALAVDPNKRFATAGEMEQALSGFARAEMPAVEPVPRPSRPARRKLWVGLPAAAAVVLVVLMVFWMLIPPSLTIEAALYRRGAEADQRLTTGDQLALGDRLFLEVSGSQPIHVYVLNEDRFGRRFRLFPLEELALENPLPAKVSHRLPGAIDAGETSPEGDSLHYWEVNTGGGEETLMLIASTQSLADLEESIASITPAGQVAETEEVRFRGIGNLVPESENRPQLSLEELREDLEESYGGEIEIWEIRLANPPAGDDD